MLSNNNFRDMVQNILNDFNLGVAKSVMPLGGTATPKFAATVPGGQFVIRVRPTDVATEAMAAFDHTMLLRLFKAGLPVPYPQKTPSGATFVYCGTEMVEILSWVHGELFKDGDIEAIKDVGLFLGKFHSTLTKDIPPGKDRMLREDHPDFLIEYIDQLKSLCTSKADRSQIDLVEGQLNFLREKLESNLYEKLPKAIIHGDIHPGNLQFCKSKVSAVYDFDYLSLQARVRDVCDALMFFAARRDSILQTDDIYSLTQPFELDFDFCRVLLDGYQEIIPLEDIEFEAMPLIIRSQWVQIRLRGSRKVPKEQKVSFVLDRFFEMIDWLDNQADTFFENLRKKTRNNTKNN